MKRQKEVATKKWNKYALQTGQDTILVECVQSVLHRSFFS